uniref:Uncharacterized protein n=1 Tax=Phlebotomus papatasi TaxID=29031 RepID=A0A1B0DK40_PHLPP
MKAIFFFVVCLFAVCLAAPEPGFVHTARVIGTPLSYIGGTPYAYRTLYPGHFGLRTYGAHYPYNYYY